MNEEFSFRFDRRFLRNALKRDYHWRPVVPVGLLIALLIAYRLYAGSFHPVVLGIVALATVIVVVRHVLAFRNLVDRTFERSQFAIFVNTD